MLGQLIKQVAYVRWLDTLKTAGVDATPTSTDAIDCAGYDRMLATLEVGATAGEGGTITFKLQECDTADGTFADLSGATIGTHTHGATGETKKSYIIDAKLNKRYVKIVYQRATQSSTIDAGIYMLYNNKAVPVEAPAGIKELVVT